MEKYLFSTDGNGVIDLNGHRSSAVYRLDAKEGKGHSFEINIRVMAPRDWLLKKGFDQDAVLISESGAHIPVYHDGGLNVGEEVSIELSARDDSCTNREDLFRKYPELRRFQLA